MSTAEARKRWARALITRPGKAVPAYGTAAWLALPEGDVCKIAAVVRAAECWATEGDDLEERLRLEVETLRLAHKRNEDVEYAARRDAHRREWERLPSQVVRLERARQARAEMFGGGDAA